MIVTFTANPSLDRTVGLTSALQRGEVQRATTVTTEPGGKGVNVARAVATAGQPTVAVLPGAADDPLIRSLKDNGIPQHAVPVEAATRINIAVTEPDGTTTKINEPGAALDEDTVKALIAAVIEESEHAEWVVMAGSLSPGTPTDLYARMTEEIRAARPGIRIAIDSSGDALRAALGAKPDLIKPNSEELAEIAGGSAAEYDESVEAAVAAARGLVAQGIPMVLATLGAKGGALVTEHGAWLASLPVEHPRSTVGAGDCTLSGFLLGTVAGDAEPDCVRRGIAYGAAATSLPGTAMPTPDMIDLDAVRLVEVRA